MNSNGKHVCAWLIHAIGCRSRSSPVVISTALYYMHRVYQTFSPATLKPIDLAITSIYLANKTEDFRVPLVLLIDAAYYHLKRRPAQPQTIYTKVARKIHSLEAMLLMYLGFDKLEGKHPHVIVANVHQRNELAKDLLECGYVISTNMLLFTDFCLRYSSEEIAAASVQVAAMWMKRDEMGYYPEAWLQKFGEGLKFEQIREMANEFIATFNAVDVAIKEEVKVMLHKYRLILKEKLEAGERLGGHPQMFPRHQAHVTNENKYRFEIKLRSHPFQVTVPSSHSPPTLPPSRPLSLQPSSISHSSPNNSQAHCPPPPPNPPTCRPPSPTQIPPNAADRSDYAPPRRTQGDSTLESSAKKAPMDLFNYF